MPGAGAIYHHETGSFGSTLKGGDAAGLLAAKAACAAGGCIQMGPGTEGIPLGAGWGIIALARIDALGRLFFSRFNMTDGDDPTKVMAWDLSAIATATTRTVVGPNYGGLLLLPATLGNSGEFLRSGGAGVQPTWATASITNALLDAANHTDTVAQAVSRGSLIYGNSTPKWDELVVGAANTVLTSNGTDVSWSANPAVQHDTLSHLKPFSVTLCTWLKNTATITHGSSGLANVKVGDFVYLGTNTTASTQGARVTVAGAGSLTVDLTKSALDTDLNNVTMIFQPGDHWDNTVALHVGTGAGLMMTTGRGTYNTTNSSGTFQELWGPVRWGSFNNTMLSDFRVAGYSGGAAAGFGIYDASNPTRVAYWNVGSLTGPANFLLPPTGGDVMTNTSTTNSIVNKTFTGTIILVSDGTTAKTVFQSGGGANFLAFSNTGNTLSNVPVQDFSPQGGMDYIYASRVTGINGKTVATTNLFTVPAGKSFITTRVVVRCTAATAITIWPTYGVGVAAGEDDIIASTAHAIAGAADTFILQIPKEGAVVATATQIIKLGIDAGATGTSMTLAVDIQGYLV